MFGRRFMRRFGGGWEGWTPPWLEERGWPGPRGPWRGPWGGPRGPWRGPWGGPGGGPWGHGGEWHGPSPEQMALRSTAAEVARLFMIASRSAAGNADRQAQLRDFLERARKELSDMIYSSGQGSSTGGEAGVEQA